MNIIVTGATGLIGRQLMPQLISYYLNANFIIISRSVKIDFLKNEKNITIINLDILNSSSQEIENVYKKFNPELFIHLAWYTHHSDYLTSNINLDWISKTKMLINAFYKNGGVKFFGLGSCIEYDWSSESPFDINKTQLSGNNTVYGNAKIEIYNFLKKINKPFIWFRIFFVFGPNQSESRLIPSLIKSYINKEKKFTANLKIKRDYISTFEISKQIILIIKTNYIGAINICSGKSFYINEISKIISKNFENNLILLENNDKNEIIDFYGSQNELLKYYSDYNYKNIEVDLIKTVLSYNYLCKK